MSAELDRDTLLAELIDAMHRELRSGGQPDPDQVAAEHPELIGELRELWAAARMADAVAMRSDSVALEPTSAAATQTSAAPPPENLGDYELLEELGRGGMGVVYRARQKSLDRVVALKVILSGELASPDQQARFRAEAEAIASLEHPGIVPIYEVATDSGQLFFSMKYVAGTTLAGRLADGPLPPRDAAGLLVDVARAIDHAHHHGVLHRDIKPANILIDEGGRAYVTDFGLAKRLTGDASLTRSGAVLGTPSYMAPEQAAGSRGELGPACDVYSLGTLLYAMLTGRPPFQAASPVDTVLLVLEQDPAPPRLLNAKADPDLEMIALRCLQKPPDLRYATAGALADDLEAFLAGEPIAARSGQFTQIIARLFRETHHATVLENWGLLWMWHSLMLLILCVVTNWFQWQGFTTPTPYLLLWGGGLAVWAPTFWALRRRGGPVTFVERQIAHIWAGSVLSAVMLFIIEYLLGLPVLKLSPVLGLTNGMAYLIKGGILAGSFYFYAAAMFLTAVAMAVLEYHNIPIGITLFGLVAAASFFIPGLKYYRQRARGDGSREAF